MTSKRVIITGSSRGLGLALAQKALEMKMDVVITSRKQDGLDKAMRVLSDHKGDQKLIGKIVDFNDKTSVQDFAKESINELGGIDVLVNNVGIFFGDRIDEDIEENLLKILNVNLFSAIRMSSAIVDHMKEQKSGSIINVISIAAKNLRKDAATYSISKVALKAYNDMLRKALKKHGISVTALYPGSMNTSSWDGIDVDHNQLIQMTDMQALMEMILSISPNAGVDEITIDTLSGI